MAYKSTTGYTGIIHTGGKYRAQTRFNKQTIELGRYDTIEEALIARAAGQRVVNKVAKMKGPAGSTLPCNLQDDTTEAGH